LATIKREEDSRPSTSLGGTGATQELREEILTDRKENCAKDKATMIEEASRPSTPHITDG
jgi:hypothetical protein